MNQLKTPLGTLHFWSGARGLAAAQFECEWQAPAGVRRGADRGSVEAFERYFAGEALAFNDVDLDLHGSDYARRVWAALRELGPKLTSYGTLAQALDSAPRAIGRAVGANPVLIAVPCHRVVGARGELRGYAAGLTRKRWLLTHEGRVGTSLRHAQP
ncbi:MAG: methylated-DNA--[protein]-cysteine S-methyltransferase [Myxococcota bacterium]